MVNAPRKYFVLASAKYSSDSVAFSDRISADLSKTQVSMKISQVVLRETGGEGRLIDTNYEIRYFYKIKSAFTAGSGKYLKYEVKFAGADGIKGVIFEIKDKLSGALYYRIFQAVTYGATKTIKVFAPFDREMILPNIRLEMKALFRTNDYNKIGDEMLVTRQMWMEDYGAS